MTTTANRPAETKPVCQVVGTRPIRHDGLDKVTGRAKYGADISLPGLLHGKVLRSPYAHARIKSIDTSAAAAAPGVVKVVTWQNAGAVKKPDSVTATLFGGPAIEHYDQAIAIVVADSFEQARAAAKLIMVDYARDKGAYDLKAAEW